MNQVKYLSKIVATSEIDGTLNKYANDRWQLVTIHPAAWRPAVASRSGEDLPGLMAAMGGDESVVTHYLLVLKIDIS